ncbi:hypothetical protein [Klebsiella pneumoniae]|uniref:hypothetical protein n=1 Tax=Klebsiella pneumoniae TaxID=573 RepID=UPI000DE66186|nr:hypothetical protein [Klebsiella pneumoniae]EKV8771731.1 hypothetical protein [Klebsiella variicola]EKW0517511.1 hypothetical protein [Klebsiella variicola]MDM9258939.1 hypothetical protein [Klebsiella pneumoniae]MDR4578046.1 hypothetical protein [Klebsiella pneumoniae]SSF01149.1 Uncharacterised protein [Klebsiella pneumoniae]
MTNNQLTPENVTRYAKYGVDMMEWPDGGYVRYEDYAALAAELQERCKVERDTEPYGFTDGDRRGMIYKPEHSDRLSEPVPVYRHAQQPAVPDDVLDALQKVARLRLDMNDFDGDRRGIADCLGDAEEALIEVVNRRAAMLAAARRR